MKVTVRFRLHDERQVADVFSFWKYLICDTTFLFRVRTRRKIERPTGPTRKIERQWTRLEKEKLASRLHLERASLSGSLQTASSRTVSPAIVTRGYGSRSIKSTHTIRFTHRLRFSSFDRADLYSSQVLQRHAHVEIKLTLTKIRGLSWTRSIEEGHAQTIRTKNCEDRCRTRRDRSCQAPTSESTIRRCSVVCEAVADFEEE